MILPCKGREIQVTETLLFSSSLPHLQLLMQRQYRNDPPGPGRAIRDRDPSVLGLRHPSEALYNLRLVRLRETVEPADRLVEHVLVQLRHLLHLLPANRTVANELHLGRVVAIPFALRHHPEPTAAHRAQDGPTVLQQHTVPNVQHRAVLRVLLPATRRGHSN